VERNAEGCHDESLRDGVVLTHGSKISDEEIASLEGEPRMGFTYVMSVIQGSCEQSEKQLLRAS